MAKWEMVRLGDYIQQLRGVSYKPEDSSEFERVGFIPLLRAHNIQSSGLIMKNLIFINKDRVQDFQYIKSGDIVICTSSGSKELVGKAAQATKDMVITFGAFCKIVRPQKGIVPNYLKHYFTSSIYRHTISQLSSGININNLRNEHIDGLQIPLPPLPVQRRIADVLDRVSALIEKRKAQINKLDLLVKSRFVEMFNNQDYPLVPISELVDNEIKSARRIFSPDEAIKYIDISSIDNIKNEVTGYTEYIFSEAPSRAQQYVIKDDILISTVRPNLKNVAIIKHSDNNIVASSGFCVLRALKCRPEFLMAIACSDAFTLEMTRVVSGASYPAIKDSDVFGYKVCFPPQQLQNEFANFVDQVDKSKFAIQKSLEELETLKKALMQQYFG